MTQYLKTQGRNRILYKVGIVTKLINTTIPASPRFYSIGSIDLSGLESREIQVLIFSYFKDPTGFQASEYFSHPKGATGFVMYTGPLSIDNENMNIDYELVGTTLSLGLLNETGTDLVPYDAPYNTARIAYFVFVF
jgi:hypothetical protein